MDKYEIWIDTDRQGTATSLTLASNESVKKGYSPTARLALAFEAESWEEATAKLAEFLENPPPKTEQDQANQILARCRDWLVAGKFGDVDDWLEYLDMEGMSPQEVIAVLAVTLPAADKLPSRLNTLIQAKARLMAIEEAKIDQRLSPFKGPDTVEIKYTYTQAEYDADPSKVLKAAKLGMVRITDEAGNERYSMSLM